MVDGFYRKRQKPVVAAINKASLTVSLFLLRAHTHTHTSTGFSLWLSVFDWPSPLPPLSATRFFIEESVSFASCLISPLDPLCFPIRFVTQRLWTGLLGGQRIRGQGRGLERGKSELLLKIQEASRGQMRVEAMAVQNKSRKRNWKLQCGDSARDVNSWNCPEGRLNNVLPLKQDS